VGVGFGVEYGGFRRQWLLVEMDRSIEMEVVVVKGGKEVFGSSKKWWWFGGCYGDSDRSEMPWNLRVSVLSGSAFREIFANRDSATPPATVDVVLFHWLQNY